MVTLKKRVEDSIDNAVKLFVKEEIARAEKRLGRLLTHKKDITVSTVEMERITSDMERLSVETGRALEMSAIHSCDKEAIIGKILDSISGIKKHLRIHLYVRTGVIISVLVVLVSAAVFVFDIRTETIVTKGKLAAMNEDIRMLKAQGRDSKWNDKKILEALDEIKTSVVSGK